ncbi:MAG: hypothetical protein KC422_10190 [Trueperaceae bacterium]|nr:hypothetical protein [Trueperaceae bacterium]
MLRGCFRVVWLFLAGIVLVSCGSGAGSLQKQVGTEPDPVEEVAGTYTIQTYPFRPGANINFGSGFSTPNERFLGVGKCLEFGNGQSSLEEILQYEPSALKLEFSMDLATSREELADKLDVSAAIKARIGVVELEGAAHVLFDDETTSNDVYLIAKGKATGHTFGFLTLGQDNVSIKGYNFDDPAASTGFGKLFREDYKAFLERCGDRFVSSITLGGEFYIIAQIETYSEEHKKDIEGSLRVSIAELGVEGSASLKKVLDKAKSQTNMKIQLISSGMFPSAETLINVQSDPGAVVQDLINGIQSQCLSLQNNIAQASKAAFGLTSVGSGEAFAFKDIGSQAIDNYNDVLEHLSVCSKQVTLSDYKMLTTEDGQSYEAIKAMNAHFTASRLMHLLQLLEDFAIDANFYIKNNYLYEAPQENPAAGEQATKTPESMDDFLNDEVANLRFVLQEQLAKCQTAQFDDCKFVSIEGYGDSTDDDYKAVRDTLRDWVYFIPPRGKWDLPNTCNALKDVRGEKEFSSSTAYTIYYQRDLSRAYQVYCLPKDAAQEVTLFGTPKDNRPDATSYYEYLQLHSPQNLARGTTHAAALNGGAFDQVNGSFEQATRYDRIRINPIDLSIEPEDLSFAFNVGVIKPVSDGAKAVYEQMPKVTGSTDNSVRAIPLGTAIGCNNTHAEASLNLQGTGLYFDPLMSERGAWWYTPFGEVKEPPRVKVTKDAISIDSGFSVDCVQLRPADFRIKLSLPTDPSILDTPGLYSDQVEFDHNPVQKFYLSGRPDKLNTFYVDDDYIIYLDGFYLGDVSYWTAAWPFKGRQGQTLDIIASNRAGGCAIGSLYVLLVDEDSNILSSHAIYEASQHPANNTFYDNLNSECSNTVGPFHEFYFVLDFPDAVTAP